MCDRIIRIRTNTTFFNLNDIPQFVSYVLRFYEINKLIKIQSITSQGNTEGSKRHWIFIVKYLLIKQSATVGISNNVYIWNSP